MNHKEIYDLNILSESLISNDETFQQACDDDLMRRLALDDERSFDSIFKLYYKDLLLYAGSYLRERQVCEDIVQSLFMHLWYDRKTLSVGRSLKSYLLISVRNRCFDYMRHQNVRNDYFDYVNENSVLSSSNTEEYILYSELQDHIKKAINKLPKAVIKNIADSSERFFLIDCCFICTIDKKNSVFIVDFLGINVLLIERDKNGIIEREY